MEYQAKMEDCGPDPARAPAPSMSLPTYAITLVGGPKADAHSCALMCLVEKGIEGDMGLLVCKFLMNRLPSCITIAHNARTNRNQRFESRMVCKVHGS